MDKGRSGRAGLPLRSGVRDSRTSLVLLLLAAQLAVAALVYLFFRGRSPIGPVALQQDVRLDHGDGSGLGTAAARVGGSGLVNEGYALRKQLAEWERRARAAGLDVAATSPPPAGFSIAKAVGAVSNDVAAATDKSLSCGVVNGHPITTMVPDLPGLMMRPAAEVAKENPDLAELLPRHANEQREIMLTFTNAVMICKVGRTTGGGCWGGWRGRGEHEGGTGAGAWQEGDGAGGAGGEGRVVTGEACREAWGTGRRA